MPNSISKNVHIACEYPIWEKTQYFLQNILLSKYQYLINYLPTTQYNRIGYNDRLISLSFIQNLKINTKFQCIYLNSYIIYLLSNSL